MGETRVDLLHLLEDLRDAYPGALEETILTEIVANSLDSGAGRIAVATDPAQATLTVADDGRGMQRRELARYHDVAASSKTRGEGIGFAGVGIKLGLLLCDEVFTETRRGTTHVATRWHLASRHRAPWKWVAPEGLVAERGTAVRLRLQNALSPLLDPGFLEASLRRYYQPLLDSVFATLLASHYPHGARVVVNGRPLEELPPETAERAPIEVRLLRKRKPSAVGYLIRTDGLLPEELRGIGISTLGKVIKRGWDWLGVAPAALDRIGGLIEVPALAGCLTLNKADFIRVGPRGATYLAYRKAIQEAVSRQLAAWGDARDATEEARRRAARPLARDLERVLMELADDFPLLASLVDRRPDGQRRLPMAPAVKAVEAMGLAAGAGAATSADGGESTGEGASPETMPEATAGAAEQSAEPMSEPPERASAEEETTLLAARGRRRPARLGLGIQFEDRPGDPELGRLVESTVRVNTAHPAYGRAAASRSEGYHVALATALALAPLAVEPVGEHAFVIAFLSSWGEAVKRAARRGRRTR